MKKLKFFVENFRKRPYLLAFVSQRNYDETRIDEEIKTTWDKIKTIFKRDEKQNLSPEISTIISNGIGGLMIGSGYAGFLYARAALQQFLDANMATKFHNSMDARFRLQDTMNLHFIRGGTRWGLRIGFFTTMFTTLYTIVGIWRERHSVWNLCPAGMISGAIYKFSLGPQGMIAGGLGGGFLSLISASLIYLILKVSGRSFEDHYQWNYIIVNARDQKIYERKKHTTETPIPDTGVQDVETLFEKVDANEEAEKPEEDGSQRSKKGDE